MTILFFRLSPINSFTTASYDNKWNGFWDRILGSNIATEIPNSPVPGEPAPDIAGFQSRVNTFAKDHGFGVVWRGGSGRKIKNQYTLECD
jgi:hypothetical protein